MPTGSDLAAGIALSAAFVGLIIAAEVWRRVGSPPVEYTRKLVHMGGGLVALAIPFLIQSHWVVLGMAAAMGVVFLGSRSFGLLPSLHAVDRRTRGVEYYPVAVYGLFVLTRGQPWLYVICLLVLALGDAMAALIGRRFGRRRFEVDGNQKSLEGSATFFVVTYLVIAIPLLCWPDPALPPPVHCLLVAFLAAVLATGFELIALDGRDNLWLPLGLCIVLTKLLRQPLDELIRQNIAFAVLAVLTAVAAFYTRALNVGAAVVFLLAAYGAWSLGSPDWAGPATAGLAVYLLARAVGESTVTVRSRRITRRLMLPFLVLVAANVAWQYDRLDWYAWLFGPYLMGCLAATVVGMGIGLSTRHLADRSRRRPDMLLVSLLAAAVSVGPGLLLHPETSWIAAAIVAALGLVVGQVYASVPPVDEQIAEQREWGTHALALASMLVVALLQWLGVSPLWNPR